MSVTIKIITYRNYEEYQKNYFYQNTEIEPIDYLIHNDLPSESFFKNFILETIFNKRIPIPDWDHYYFIEKNEYSDETLEYSDLSKYYIWDYVKEMKKNIISPNKYYYLYIFSM